VDVRTDKRSLRAACIFRSMLGTLVRRCGSWDARRAKQARLVSVQWHAAPITYTPIGTALNLFQQLIDIAEASRKSLLRTSEIGAGGPTMIYSSPLQCTTKSS